MSMDAKLELMQSSEPGTYSKIAEIVLKRLREKILSRFDVSSENLVSALLDPALKNVSWLDEYFPTGPNKMTKDRKQLLKESVKKFGITVEDAIVVNENKPNNNVLKTRMELFKDLGLVCSTTQKKNSIDQEIDDYFELQVFEIPDSPIDWWDVHKQKFPRLKQLFEAFLSAAPSSSSSERAFSKAGKFMSADRSNLNPLSLNMLCFVNANIKILEEHGDIFLVKKE